MTDEYPLLTDTNKLKKETLILLLTYMVTIYCVSLTSLVICVNYLICVQPLPELEVVMAWMIKLRKQWLMWTTCMLYDIIPHLVTRAIYRLRDRERESALAVTIHPCCQFGFVWLNLHLKYDRWVSLNQSWGLSQGIEMHLFMLQFQV